MITLTDLLRSRALSNPGQSFHTIERGHQLKESLSVSQLEEAASRVGASLQARGLQPGDRVMLVCHDPLHFLKGFWGCLHAGVIVVPAPPTMGTREYRTLPHLRAVFADCKPKLTLTDDPSLTVDRAVLVQECEGSDFEVPIRAGSDIAVLQYTSGSTRTPKGVMLSHRNLLHNLSLLRQFHGQTSEAKFLHWLPLHHDMGLIRGVLSPLEMGASCYLMDPLEFLKRPRRWLEALTHFRATITGAPNFGYARVVDKVHNLEGLDLSSLELAFCSAEPIREKTVLQFLDRFSSAGLAADTFKPAYGLAEATVAVCGEMRGHCQSQSGLVCCGQVLGDQQVLIVDPSGVLCADGVTGEIWIQGESVAEGYWQAQEDSELTFGAHLADGRGPYLRTGDLGYLDQRGLTVSGRLKDLLIVRGQNYSPQDLEATVEEEIAVLRPGCTTVINSESGLLLTCEIREAPGDFEELAGLVRASLGENYGLALFGFVVLAKGTTPKTASGKLQRGRVATLHREGKLDAIWSWTRS